MTKLTANTAFRISQEGASEYIGHRFDDDDILAIEAARLSRRPLLLRGDPGVGKSQLALATAVRLGWGFVKQVVDAATEVHELRWREDLITRLAEAQLIGALRQAPLEDDADAPLAIDQAQDLEAVALRVRERLSRARYVIPGPLWWGFDWDGAKAQAELLQDSPPAQPDGKRCDPSKGVVVLIDEIDKAVVDVPNGLLDALGAREFRPPGSEKPVKAGDRWPLVVVTTNDERALPDAFIRRCVVHEIRVPDDSQKDFIDYLCRRALAHFPTRSNTRRLSAEVLAAAAEMVWEDRDEAKKYGWRPFPGQAEYLDLLRTLSEKRTTSISNQIKTLQKYRKFFLRKHPDSRRQ